MSAVDFLLEIGCEELPAQHLPELQHQLKTMLVVALEKSQLSFQQVTAYSTPRRLAVIVHQLSEVQPEQTIEKKGPAEKAAFDAQGNPSKGLQGFARSCNASIDELTVRDTDKGKWFYFKKNMPGKRAAELLPEMLQTILEKMPMPKRMRWGGSDAAFLRPIRWLCAMLNDDILAFECFGIKARNLSYGHRFHHPAAITILNATSYCDQLQKAYVIVDTDIRRQIIKQTANDLAKTVNGVASVDEDLLAEVSGLVEWPVPLLVNFDPSFLDVPQEVLISSMQDHQKCFPVLNGSGKILPHFITVSNIESKDVAKVINGNKRVMRARLSDAEFFYRTDSKQRLDTRVEQLNRVVFQAKLGTLQDKTERIALLSQALAKQWGIDPDLARRAATLCKADLLTDMVGEFPELQGTMGYYYALNDGESDSVATAIQEHYMPRFAGDSCPATPLGVVVALADRVDTLIGIFGINMAPTGDKDPYALRRAANGILRICIEHQLPFDLRHIFTKAVLDYKIDLSNKHVVDDCLAFIFDRLKAYSIDLGFDVLIYSAVLANKPTSPYDFYQRMSAVKQFHQDPAADALVAANKRVSNILKKAGFSNSNDVAIDLQLLQEASEQALVASLTAKQQQLHPLLQQQMYPEILQNLAELRQPIDEFFDSVMVMVDDEKIRLNRLAILSALRQLFTQIADIALLAGSKM